MKTEKEIQKFVDQTSALVEETTQVFIGSIRAYLSGIAEQIRTCAKRMRDERLRSEAQKELATIAGSLPDVVRTITRHSVAIQRELKVAVHKNEAKAYERLLAALDRMKQESTDFQEKMRRLASRKSENK